MIAMLKVEPSHFFFFLTFIAERWLGVKEGRKEERKVGGVLLQKPPLGWPHKFNCSARFVAFTTCDYMREKTTIYEAMQDSVYIWLTPC